MKRRTRRFAFPIGLLLLGSLGGCTEPTAPVGWVSAGTLLDARGDHSATLLDDGSVLFVGGNNTRGLVASAELRETAKNQWSLPGSLHAARSDHGAVKLGDGRVLVVGGKNISGASGCVEIYDPNNRDFTTDETWTWDCPEQPGVIVADWSIRTGLGNDETSVHEERIVLADGNTGKTVLLDPAKNVATVTERVSPVARADDSMTLVTRENHKSVFDVDAASPAVDDAVLLAVGGANDSTVPVAEFLDVVACVNESQCAWRSVDMAGVSRKNHSVTNLGHGDVLVVGGQDKDGNVLKTAEVYRLDWTRYDNNEPAWTVVAAKDLVVARQGHTATRLNNGQVLIVGGRNEKGEPLASVELYQVIHLPNGELEFDSQEMQALSTPRVGHTATWLPNGSVLVAGGSNAPSSYVATAERFVPEDTSIPCVQTEDCPQAMICNLAKYCEQSAAPLELQGSCAYAGERGPWNAGVLAALAGLASAWVWRRKRRIKRAAAFLSVGGILLGPGLSEAQTPTFYLDRLPLAAGSEDGTAVWRPVFGRTGFFGQLAVGYAYNPLRAASFVHDPARAETLDGSALTLQEIAYATAGFEFARRGALQVTLPYVIKQDGYATDNRRAGLDQVVSVQRSTLGDIRIDGRMLLAWNEAQTFVVAVRVAGYLPTGDEYSFSGEGHAWGQVGLAAEYKNDTFFLTANAGLTMRPESSLGDLTVGPEVNYAFGAYLPFRDDRLRLGAELWGAVGLSSQVPEALPVEAALSSRFSFGKEKRVFLGVSAGGRLGKGYAPDARVQARIGGVLPFTDAPLEPSLPVRLVPPADTDGDGFVDVDDKCPQDLEDNKREKDGCPETDEDGDGIDTVVDKCPTVPEDKDGLADEDGCPELDFDGDGFVDVDDKCPKEPGVRNEDPEKLGCPQFIERTKTEVKLSKQIEFEFEKATITPTSFPILDEIAKLMKANPDIKQLRIEGHTDNQGDAVFNQGLSVRRAEAVKEYLVRRGKIDPSRLSFAGFGPTKPIAPNDTEAGRAKNRRVELHIGGGEGGEEKK